MGNKNKEKRQAARAVQAAVQVHAEGNRKEPYVGHYEFEHTGFKKMIFRDHAVYNGAILYQKDKIVDVPNAMVDRWLKRGGVLADESTLEVVEESDEEGSESGQEEDDKSLETSETLDID